MAPPSLQRSTSQLQNSLVCCLSRSTLDDTRFKLKIIIKFIWVMFFLCRRSEQQDDQRHCGWHRDIDLPAGVPGSGCHLLLQKPLWSAYGRRREIVQVERPKPQKGGGRRGDNQRVSSSLDDDHLTDSLLQRTFF